MRDELPITAVTVHPDGAWVTRAGPLDVVGGRATARRLPFQLDESAVEASVDGAVVSALQLSLDTLGRDRGDVCPDIANHNPFHLVEEVLFPYGPVHAGREVQPPLSV